MTAKQLANRPGFPTPTSALDPRLRSTARAVVASFITLVGCVNTPVLDPCQPYGEGHTAIVFARMGVPFLLDGRPFAAPWQVRESLSCDGSTLSLPAGPHSLHVKVGAEHDWLSCHFVAEPGHRYELRLKAASFGSFRCEVTDEASGVPVNSRDVCVEATAPHLCPEGAKEAAEVARVQVYQAYAACGDSDARLELRERQAHGSVRFHLEDWTLPECSPFFDRRRD